MLEQLLFLQLQLHYLLDEEVLVGAVNCNLEQTLEQLNDLVLVLILGYLQQLHIRFLRGRCEILALVLPDSNVQDLQVTESLLPGFGLLFYFRRTQVQNLNSTEQFLEGKPVGQISEIN